MSSKRLTQEEKVLLVIFRSHHPVKILNIAHSLGLSDKSCHQAIHLLLHGNFIKKREDEKVELTEHGKKLCLKLIQEG